MANFKVESANILQTASLKAVQNLLELNSVKSIREHWTTLSGNKAELCLQIASHRNHEETIRFLFNNFSCCKQHNYVFSHDMKVKEFPSINVMDSECVGKSVSEDSVILLYIAKVHFKVILWNPRGEETITLLLPFQIEIIPNYMILRFITLEKNLVSYYGNLNHHIISRSLDEKSFLELLQESAIKNKIVLSKTDLHKGIKTLMKSGVIAAVKAKIKKFNRMTNEIMDEGFEVKTDAPEVYEAFMKNDVRNSVFRYKSEEDKFSVKNFSSDPLEGTIDFSTYSERKGDTDYVIREILKNN